MATHSAILSWTASTDPVDGYFVYRGTAAGGEAATAINSAIITGTTFTDPNVTGGVDYFYYVTSSKGGVQSVHSSEVNSVIPPAPPTNVTITVT